MIRCTDKFGIIAAGDGISGYVLEKIQYDHLTNEAVFSIFSKFDYEHETGANLASNYQPDSSNSAHGNQRRSGNRSGPTRTNRSNSRARMLDVEDRASLSE